MSHRNRERPRWWSGWDLLLEESLVRYGWVPWRVPWDGAGHLRCAVASMRWSHRVRTWITGRGDCRFHAARPEAAKAVRMRWPVGISRSCRPRRWGGGGRRSREAVRPPFLASNRIVGCRGLREGPRRRAGSAKKVSRSIRGMDRCSWRRGWGTLARECVSGDGMLWIVI